MLYVETGIESSYLYAHGSLKASILLFYSVILFLNSPYRNIPPIQYTVCISYFHSIELNLNTHPIDVALPL